MRVERERDVDLNVLQQQIDTSTAAGRMLFAMLDAVGEFERDPLSERTRDGLRASRARGRTGDRKSKLKAAHGQPARPMLGELDDGLRWPHTVQDIARQAAGDKVQLADDEALGLDLPAITDEFMQAGLAMTQTYALREAGVMAIVD